MNFNTPPNPTFADKILAWFDQHGRKDLPWQTNPTAYRVWVSEIMLQQTQVSTVIPYYERFMQSFPDLLSLADAPLDDVLKHWEGLGYYTRARNLHKTAQSVRDHYAGHFPTEIAQVEALSGIGRSTAGAILSLSHNQRHAILDGNVKRVLARYHAVATPTNEPRTLKQLWDYAEQHLPNERYNDYTQAMMDMGATLCTRSKPACLLCPIQNGCQAFKQGNPTTYPVKKPSKTNPEKTRVGLLLRNQQGEILLTQRPPTGIWGGLWSFPEFADYHALQTWLAEQCDTALTTTLLTNQTHTFSHYTLNLPLYGATVQDFSPSRVMEGSNLLWYKAGTRMDGGLSAAVRQFLAKTHDSI